MSSDDSSDAPSDEDPSDIDDRQSETNDSAEPALGADETEETRQQNELLRRRIYEYLLGKSNVPDHIDQQGSDRIQDYAHSFQSKTSTRQFEGFEIPGPVNGGITSKKPAKPRRSASRQVDGANDDEGQLTPRSRLKAKPAHKSGSRSTAFSRKSAQTPWANGAAKSGSYDDGRVANDSDHPKSMLVDRSMSCTRSDSLADQNQAGSDHGFIDDKSSDSASTGADDSEHEESDGSNDADGVDSSDHSQEEQSAGDVSSSQSEVSASDDYLDNHDDQMGILDDSEYHESAYFDETERSDEDIHGRQREYKASAQTAPEGYIESPEVDEDEEEEAGTISFTPVLYAAKGRSQSLQSLPPTKKPSEKRLSLSSHFSAQPAPADDGFQLDNISLPSWQMHAMDEASRAAEDDSSVAESSTAGSQSHDSALADSDEEDNDGEGSDSSDHEPGESSENARGANGNGERNVLLKRSISPNSCRPSESQRIHELANDNNIYHASHGSPPPMTPLKLLQKLPDAVAQSIPALDFRPTIPPPQGKPAEPFEPLYQAKTIDDKPLTGPSSVAGSDDDSASNQDDNGGGRNKTSIDSQNLQEARGNEPSSYHLSKCQYAGGADLADKLFVSKRNNVSLEILPQDYLDSGQGKGINHPELLLNEDSDNGSSTNDAGSGGADYMLGHGVGGRPSLADAKRAGLDDDSRPSESQRMLLFADEQPSNAPMCAGSPPPAMPSKSMQKLSDAFARDLPSGDFRPTLSPPPSSGITQGAFCPPLIDTQSTAFDREVSPESARTHETQSTSFASEVSPEPDRAHTISHAFEPQEDIYLLSTSSAGIAGKQGSGALSIGSYDETDDHTSAEPMSHGYANDADNLKSKKEQDRRGFCYCFIFIICLVALAIGFYFGLRDEQEDILKPMNLTDAPSSAPVLLLAPSWSPTSAPVSVTTEGPTLLNDVGCVNAVAAQVGGLLFPGDFSSTSLSSISGYNMDIDVGLSGEEEAGYNLWYSFRGTNLFTTLRYCVEADGSSLSFPWILTGDCQNLLQDIRLSQNVVDRAVSDQCFDISFRSQSSVEYKILFRSQSQTSSFYFFLMDNRSCKFASPLDSLESITQRNYDMNETASAPPICSSNNSSTPETAGTWYTVQGTGSDVTVSTCGSVLAETGVTVYSGDCSNLQCVSGGSGLCDDGQNSYATFTADSTHLVYVTAEFQGIIGAAVISARESNSSEISTGTDCAAASAIDFGEEIQDSIEATPLPIGVSEDPATCLDSAGSLVTIESGGSWYEFVGTGASVTLDIICQDSSQALHVSVYRARISSQPQECIDYRCVVAIKDVCNAGIDWLARQGKAYYIMFHVSSDEPAAVPFEFTVQLSSSGARRDVELPHRRLRRTVFN